MCLAPIIIENPYFNSPIKDSKFRLAHNTVDSHIAVPCGRCSVCLHLKQIYMVQRVQMEALCNDLFFGTLTYNKESLPVAKFGDIEFAYVDLSDWQKMIKMIRKDYPDLKFKYLLVTEYGSKKHRPHIHFILSLLRSSDLLSEKIGKAYDLFHIFLKYWRRNVAPKVWSDKRQKFITDSRNPEWIPLCTYKRNQRSYNFDLHYLDPLSSKDGTDGVSFYVTKYVLKYDDWVDKFKSKLFFNLDEEQYKEAFSLFRPRVLISKGFGSPDSPLVKKHIIEGINLALHDPKAFKPYYISRNNGQTFPLAPYYQQRFLTVDSQIIFHSRLPDNELSDVDIYDFDQNQFKLSEVQSFLFQKTNLFDYEEI